jgi:hypothetical protein
VNFGLLQVLLESFLELGVLRGFGHLWESLNELRFGMQEVLQIFDQQFLQLIHGLAFQKEFTFRSRIVAN